MGIRKNPIVVVVGLPVLELRYPAVSIVLDLLYYAATRIRDCDNVTLHII